MHNFFYNLQSWERTHAVLVIGLYELLGNPTTYLTEPLGPSNNFLSNTTQKTKDRTKQTRIPLEIMSELMCLRIISHSCTTSDKRRVTVKDTP